MNRAPSPAQQVDDWNRRMAPMVDVIVKDGAGFERPGTIDGQAYLLADVSVVTTRFELAVGGTIALPVPLCQIRTMTDADRVQFGLVTPHRVEFCREVAGVNIPVTFGDWRAAAGTNEARS